MSIQTTALHRPRLINVAILIALCISLAGLAILFMFMPSLVAHMQAQGLPTEGFNNSLIYAGAILSVLFTAAMCFFISRGNNVVRWVWAAFTVYGLVSAIAGMRMTFSISTLFGIVGIALQLLAIASAVLLFMPVSAAWFKAIKQAKNAF